MEVYELASKLLLKEGEPCWDLSGHISLSEQDAPILHAKVVIGKERAGETRTADFIYTGDMWLRM